MGQIQKKTGMKHYYSNYYSNHVNKPRGRKNTHEIEQVFKPKVQDIVSGCPKITGSRDST